MKVFFAHQLTFKYGESVHHKPKSTYTNTAYKILFVFVLSTPQGSPTAPLVFPFQRKPCCNALLEPFRDSHLHEENVA